MPLKFTILQSGGKRIQFSTITKGNDVKNNFKLLFLPPLFTSWKLWPSKSQSLLARKIILNEACFFFNKNSKQWRTRSSISNKRSTDQQSNLNRLIKTKRNFIYQNKEKWQALFSFQNNFLGFIALLSSQPSHYYHPHIYIHSFKP